MLTAILLSANYAQAQLKIWTLPPKQILIPAVGVATVTSLPGGFTPYEVANGAYEENGNLIFYAEADNNIISIYNSLGTSIGSLNTLYSSVTGYYYTQIGEELSIVPVPGSCRQFYVIFSAGAGALTGSAVGYAKIDCNSGVTISTQTTLVDYWGGNSSAIAVSKVTDVQAGSRYLFAMGYSSINRYTITSTGIASKTLIANDATIGSNSNYWITSQLVLSPDQTQLAWGSTNGGINNKVFQITLSGYSYFSSTSYPFAGDTYLHCVEFNSNSDRIFVSTNNGLKYIYGGAVYTIPSSSTYNNCQLGLALSNYIYCTDNTGKFGRINANAVTPTVALASGLSGDLNYGNDTYAPISSSCYRLPDQIEGEDYSYFFSIKKAFANFSINGNPIACPSYNQLYNCAAGSMILNNLTTGAATSFTIQVRSATGADCNTTTSTYTGPVVTIAAPLTSYDLKTYDGGYLTSALHTGYYIVYFTACNACNVVTTQQALIKVDNIGAYAADYKLLYNPTGQCTINPGGSCAAAAPVSSLYAPLVCVSFSTGILCEYWMRVWDYGTFCPGNANLIADGSSNHSTIPGCSTTGLQVNLDYYIGTHPVGAPGNNYTVNHTYHYYKVELNAKNDCGTVTKTGWIINNCPTCKWGDQVSADVLQMNIFPNPASDEIIVSGIPEAAKELSIISIDGKLIRTIPLSNVADEIRISVADLKDGMYLIMCPGSPSSVIKFIITN